MLRSTLPAALAGALLLASCQTSDRDPVPLPPGPQQVEVELTEYSFSYNPVITSGRVLFRVRNTGTVVHSLQMLPLSEDIPPIDQQVRGSQRLAVRPFAGVDALDPATSTTFSVDLAPGVRYALLCFQADKDGTSHLLRGMTSEFRTAAPAPALTPRPGDAPSPRP